MLHAGLSLVEYDAIEVKPTGIELPAVLEHVIFTSQNAVKAAATAGVLIKNCYCVGDKTEKALKDLGCRVKEKGYQAADLAQKITANYQNISFSFFCGNKRREELPAMLRKAGIALEEFQVYSTESQPRAFTREFDGVLFFSPSAVESFFSKNTLGGAVAFTIGKTTEKSLKKHTNNIITANKSTVENVIVQAVKYFAQR